MSKLAFIATVFSVVLIVLFVIFSFLISKVNPPPKKDEANFRRLDDSDYFVNQNDVLLPGDNVAYGLEKVDNDCDDVIDDTLTSKTIKIKSGPFKPYVKPTVRNDSRKMWPKMTKANCSKEQTNDLKLVTRPIKAIKDFRRSINEENYIHEKDEVPRSLLLKINGVDGQPQIEIKVLHETVQNRKIRSFSRTSEAPPRITYSGSGAKNNSKETYLNMDENKTFILNIYANVIDVISDNETIASYTFDKLNNIESDTSYFDTTSNPTLDVNDYNNNHDTLAQMTTITLIDEKGNATNTYDFNLNTSNNLISLITETSLMNTYKLSNEERNTKVDEYNQNLIEGNSDVELQATIKDTLVREESNSSLHTAFESESRTEVHLSTSTEDKVYNNTWNNSLVSLLIPEATATLPINNFINNWTGLEW